MTKDARQAGFGAKGLICREPEFGGYSTFNFNVTSSENDYDVIISSYIINESEFVEKSMTSSNENDFDL